MEHITEYTIAINGKVDSYWPTTEDHAQAQRDRQEWLALSPDDKVDIMHRRVVRHDWALTTP